MNPAWVLAVSLADFADEASCRAKIPQEQAYLIEAGEPFIVTCTRASLGPTRTIRPVARPTQE